MNDIAKDYFAYVGSRTTKERNARGVSMHSMDHWSSSTGSRPGERTRFTWPSMFRTGLSGVGQRDVALAFGGATFCVGDWVYSDEDGVVVSVMRL
jgi:hypothetical protein